MEWNSLTIEYNTETPKDRNLYKGNKAYNHLIGLVILEKPYRFF